MRTITCSREIIKGETHQLNDYKIRFNKKRILKALDCYESSDLYEEINELFEELKEEVMGCVEPEIVFKVEAYDSYLGPIKELQGFKEVIYKTTTLGDKLSMAIGKRFTSGEYMEAMLMDAMGTSILFDISEQSYKVIYDYVKAQDRGIVSLSPGERNAPITYQKIIEDQLGKDSSVRVTEGFLLEPVKSASTIYGIKEGIELSKLAHNCRHCPDLTCKWRVMPYEN